jgi:hypothetical protein
MEEREKKGILALTGVFCVAYIRHRSIHVGAFLQNSGLMGARLNQAIDEIPRLRMPMGSFAGGTWKAGLSLDRPTQSPLP